MLHLWSDLLTLLYLGMAFRVYGQAATVAMLLGYATYAGHGPFAIVNNKIRTLFGYPPLEIHNSGIIKND